MKIVNKKGLIRSNMNIEIKVTAFDVKVFINNKLHLNIQRTGLFGIQSWKSDGLFCIEWYHKKGNILTEYDKNDVWEELLKQINEKVMF